MKTTIKLLGVILITGIIGIGLLLIATQEERNVHKNDVAHCIIFLGDSVENLTNIEFIICDRTYKYSINELKDTISENLGISNKRFPCAVQVIYNFNSSDKKIVKADSFNIQGSSGANKYILKRNTIVYQYAY